LDRRLGGPRTVLDAVVKRKIPSPRRESKPRTPIIKSVIVIIQKERKMFMCMCNKMAVMLIGLVNNSQYLHC
jgi:hypothetical protein